MSLASLLVCRLASRYHPLYTKVLGLNIFTAWASKNILLAVQERHNKNTNTESLVYAVLVAKSSASGANTMISVSVPGLGARRVCTSLFVWTLLENMLYDLSSSLH